jgi:hypothetical protein
VDKLTIAHLRRASAKDEGDKVPARKRSVYVGALSGRGMSRFGAAG